MPHIINREETECETFDDREEARQVAIVRNWVILDLGWCPICHYCILGGTDGKKYEYARPIRTQRATS